MTYNFEVNLIDLPWNQNNEHPLITAYYDLIEQYNTLYPTGITEHSLELRYAYPNLYELSEAFNHNFTEEFLLGFAQRVYKLAGTIESIKIVLDLFGAEILDFNTLKNRYYEDFNLSQIKFKVNSGESLKDYTRYRKYLVELILDLLLLRIDGCSLNTIYYTHNPTYANQIIPSSSLTNIIPKPVEGIIDSDNITNIPHEISDSSLGSPYLCGITMIEEQIILVYTKIYYTYYKMASFYSQLIPTTPIQ